MSRDSAALIAFLESREAWRFGYDRAPMTHDCARAMSDGIKAQTGRAPLDRFASEWTTRRGALRVIRRHGGLAAAVDTVMTRVDLPAAQRGDAGMTRDGALVLIEGDTLVGPADIGWQRLPREQLAIAWSAE
ncbi:DUF6950 family protein [Brevundimonas mediterranea]|jgi:hypothetical protein|uniref:DUF6950 domain-containing protein n=1 Tax=Brevundimonas mediterranea TaxID=74329 RepID=A0A7Z8Y5V8_9CAUL|nr:hypothetical protein [Brevundimonas mediterranea]VDC51444.1 hypothetical protein BREV_BREV_00513 [Brevundimonas mediterranea]